MYIEHFAIWTKELNLMRDFYVKYFNLTCNDKYTNTKKHYESYFLTFNDGKSRIELMRRPDILPNKDTRYMTEGLAHFALSVGSEKAVDDLTERLRSDGYTIISKMRHTGDGYYESAVLDPENNYIEITV